MERPRCCSGYVAGGGRDEQQRVKPDRWNESTRLRNSFASLARRESVTPETNVVFMTPGSASGPFFFQRRRPEQPTTVDPESKRPWVLISAYKTLRDKVSRAVPTLAARSELQERILASIATCK
jgi:hypothetical protein